MRRTMKYTSLLMAVGIISAYGVARHVSGRPLGDGDPAWLALVRDSGWSRFADMNGYRLHYLDAGQGRPVLLIHGYGDSVYSWRRNIVPLIQAGFRVVAVDMPGLGQSEAPAGFAFSAEAVTGEIVSFLDRLGLDRVDVIGNSMGGQQALMLAACHPDRVRSIVPVGAACYPVKLYETMSSLARHSLVRDMIRPFTGPWQARWMLRRCYTDQSLVTPENYSQRAQPFARRDYAENLLKMGGEFFSPAFVKLSGEYAAIKVPALLVWGDHDRVIKTEDNALRLHRDMPGSRLEIIPRSGHVPHDEQFEIFNRMVIDFLREH